MAPTAGASASLHCLQKQDLERAAQLFEDVGDKGDKIIWEKRFKEHVYGAMAKYGKRMKAARGALDQAMEVSCARFEFLDVVWERLQDRAQRLDPGLGSAVSSLRLAYTPLLQELIASLRTALGVSAPMSPRQSADACCAAAVAASTNGPSHPAACSSRRVFPNPLVVESAVAVAKPEAKGLHPRACASSAASDGDRHHASLISYGSGGSCASRSSYREIHHSRRGYSVDNAKTFKALEPTQESLTLSQLRGIISGLYASKVEHDKRCFELQEPLETMEQHLYNYLGRRYPCTTIVQQWAANIYRAIKKYAGREVDVLVFGKILQNRLSESFSTVQQTLVATAQNLLRTAFEATSTDPDFDARWREKMRSGFSIAECAEVVHRMYSELDAEAVIERFKLFAERHAQGMQRKEVAPLASGMDLRYGDFLHILLTFQLHLTEAFLSHFCVIFRDIDTDRDGVLNNFQLQELVARLAELPDSQALQSAASIAEARIHDRPQMTFSECVEALSDVISARWDAYEDQQAKKLSEYEEATTSPSDQVVNAAAP